MIVPAGARIAAFRSERQRLLQLESQKGFSGNVYTLASCRNLADRAGSSASQRADRRTFPTPGHRAKNCAK